MDLAAWASVVVATATPLITWAYIGYTRWERGPENLLVIGVAWDPHVLPVLELRAEWRGTGRCWDIRVEEFEGVEFLPTATLHAPVLENGEVLTARFVPTGPSGRIVIGFRPRYRSPKRRRSELTAPGLQVRPLP